MTTMTITQALNELKLLDKRIEKVVVLPKVGFKIGTKMYNNFDPEQAKSDLQSFNDLVSRRAKIKMLINKSNIETEVKVDNKTMSVLEAIEYKATIEYKNIMLRTLKQQYSNVTVAINNGNETVKQRLDSQISSVFEKSTDKDIKSFTDTFNKNNSYEMVNPIDIEKILTDLDAEIDNFTNEVDYVLSTSNATTTITF